MSDRKTPFPLGTKRKYAVGGLVCLAIWPGIGFIELLTGLLEQQESWYLVASPWILITLMGISLLLVPATIKERKPRRGEQDDKER